MGERSVRASKVLDDTHDHGNVEDRQLQVFRRGRQVLPEEEGLCRSVVDLAPVVRPAHVLFRPNLSEKAENMTGCRSHVIIRRHFDWLLLTSSGMGIQPGSKTRAKEKLVVNKPDTGYYLGSNLGKARGLAKS